MLSHFLSKIPNIVFHAIFFLASMKFLSIKWTQTGDAYFYFFLTRVVIKYCQINSKPQKSIQYFKSNLKNHPKLPHHKFSNISQQSNLIYIKFPWKFEISVVQI
jgi:hypothetical protein